MASADKPVRVTMVGEWEGVPFRDVVFASGGSRSEIFSPAKGWVLSPDGGLIFKPRARELSPDDPLAVSTKAFEVPSA
jgi:hypothetical protein